MKKIIILCLLFAATKMSFGQGLSGINYQAIARNLNGTVLDNKAVQVRFTITAGNAGAVQYRESQNVTTNAYGLFNVVIGKGTALSGTFSGIPWSNANQWLEVEVGVAGSSFTSLGKMAFQSVPFSQMALQAFPAGVAGGDLAGSTYPNPVVAAQAITTGKLADGSVTTAKLADNAVTTIKITDANVTTPKLADAAVTAIKIAPGVIPVSLPPSGAAGGDLTGTYPNPTINIPLAKTSSQATNALISMTNSAATGTAGAIQASSASTDGNATAIQATLSSTTPGGFSSAIRGINNGTGGLGIGVYGSQAGNGWGVLGIAPGGIGVNGTSGSGIGVNGTATSGTAGRFSTTSGLAINSTGALKFDGINEAAGRVLTSDANGNATWQPASLTGAVSGSGTLNYLPKWTPAGTALGDSRIEDRNGTRPIGINTPAGYTYLSTLSGLELTTSTANDQTRILLRDQSDGGDVQGFVDARTSSTTGFSGMQVGTLTNHPITFFTNGNSSGRWSATGNLGIGTAAGTDPTSRLQVEGNGTPVTVVPGLGTFSIASYTKNIIPATDSKVAVLGYSDGISGLGQSNGVAGIGYGNGAANFGVFGTSGPITNPIGLSVGVFGTTEATGPNAYAGFFYGKTAIIDGTQGTGKVLTSDGSGNASWQDLVTPNVGIGMNGFSVPFISLPNNTYLPITQWGNIKHENGGANYNSVTGEYTITVAGVYQINASLNMYFTTIAGTVEFQAWVSGNIDNSTLLSISGNNMAPQMSYLRQCNVDDKLSFMVYQNTGTSQNIVNDISNNFSVQLIHK